MNLREQIVKTARSWLGTPFIHQGRVKNIGCDCLGLIIGVATELGLKINDKYISEYDSNSYSTIPDGRILKAKLDEILTKKQKDSARPGDIFLMNFAGNPQHIGIFSEYMNGPAMAIIHCYSQSGKVVEHRLNDFWFSKIEQVYSILD